MGIDNNAILVYGWTFSDLDFYHKIMKILHSAGIVDDDMGMYEYMELFNEWLNDNHPNFVCGAASPYYDSYYTERTYYLSFINIETYEALTKIHKDGMDSYNLLGLIDIDTDPVFYALVHVR